MYWRLHRIKPAAVLLFAGLLMFCVLPAWGESSTSEIEKIVGFASWLFGEAAEAQQEKREQRDLETMLWMYDDTNAAAPDDVPEIADMLTKLGIDGITDEHIIETIRVAENAQTCGYLCSQELIVLYLLSAVGMGVYDDDFVWHPSSDSVLYLDMELFGETLYGDFFKGLNAICCGEFVFEDLVEDYAGADLAEGGGVIGLSFFVNGEQHALEATMMQDWFDVEVFNAAAEIAVEKESGRRLYAMYDGMQGLIIVYQTPEWVQLFETQTGCLLRMQL